MTQSGVQVTVMHRDSNCDRGRGSERQQSRQKREMVLGQIQRSPNHSLEKGNWRGLKTRFIVLTGAIFFFLFFSISFSATPSIQNLPGLGSNPSYNCNVRQHQVLNPLLPGLGIEPASTSCGTAGTPRFCFFFLMDLCGGSLFKTNCRVH